MPFTRCIFLVSLLLVAPQNQSLHFGFPHPATPPYLSVYGSSVPQEKPKLFTTVAVALPCSAVSAPILLSLIWTPGCCAGGLPADCPHGSFYLEVYPESPSLYLHQVLPRPQQEHSPCARQGRGKSFMCNSALFSHQPHAVGLSLPCVVGPGLVPGTQKVPMEYGWKEGVCWPETGGRDWS